MAEAKVPPAERIVSSYKQLASEITECNTADTELADQILILHAALAKLKPQDSARHQIAKSEEENGDYWTRDIGYSKVSDQWGISLRRTRRNEFHDHHA